MPADHQASTLANDALHVDPAYYDALLNDPVDKARKLISSCRSSRQRRDDLQVAIREGNATKAFRDEQLPPLELLRDMEVRWSSTYFMIERFLVLYPV